MSKWKEYSLVDLVSFSQGIQVPVDKQFMEKLSNTERFIRIVDYTEPNEQPRYIEKVSDKYWALPDDVIMIRYGSKTAGKVTRGISGYIANNMFKVNVIDERLLDKEFLYYFLSQKSIYDYLMSSQSSSTMPAIKFSDLNKLNIRIPEIREQEKIIDILNGLNNKIQLNTQINQTLEQIAAAIFKSWFIDFDPVHAKADFLAQGSTTEQANLAAMSVISGKTREELTALPPEKYQELYALAEQFPSGVEVVDGVEVPRGWEFDTLNNLFDVGIGKTPPRKEEQWFTENNSDIEWISIKDMGNQGTFITHSSEYLTAGAVDKFNIKVIPENTVILSFKLTLGRVAITTQNTTTNEAIAHFKLNDNSVISTEYLYLWFKQYDFNSLGSTSSIATAVNSKTIKNIEMLVPSLELLSLFNKKVKELFKLIRENTTENQNLEEARDLLLPKLLNGELIMKETNKAISYFTMGKKFLNLARSSMKMLVETGNPHSILSDEPLSSKEYDEQTKWSDFNIGTPILFNFYHGIELMLKGAINIKDESFSSHKFSKLTEKYIELYSEDKLIYSILKCTTEMPEKYGNSENLMKKFLNDNSIDIDLWYQALKYPFDTRGLEFNHFSFKYGNTKTLDFWGNLAVICEEIIIKSAEFYHSFTSMDSNAKETQ